MTLGGIESSDQRGLPVLESLWRDTCHGVRILRKHPGFTAVALLTLTVCIGASLAIFAVVDAILVRSLPLPQANPTSSGRSASDFIQKKITLSGWFRLHGRVSGLDSAADV
jgi:hypothetical protein